MGIYIDMEMPECCDKCWALDDYGDYPRCRITEEQRGYTFPIREKRMYKCPLIPIPPQTNADRIRQMTDEELAEWIVHKTEGNGFDGYEQIVLAWLRWLKSPAEKQKEDD